MKPECGEPRRRARRTVRNGTSSTSDCSLPWSDRTLHWRGLKSSSANRPEESNPGGIINTASQTLVAPRKKPGKADPASRRGVGIASLGTSPVAVSRGIRFPALVVERELGGVHQHPQEVFNGGPARS